MKHMPLSELKEAVTPKYSGDTRYQPIDEVRKGVGTKSIPSGLPTEQPEPKKSTSFNRLMETGATASLLA